MNISMFFSKDQHDVNEFFRLRRQRRYKQHGAKAKCIWLHNCMHYVLVYVLKLMRLFEGRKLTVIGDKRENRKTHRPVIYACTHIGGSDIESAFEAIKSPCYLFLGDPRELYRSIDGLILGINGVICFETSCKQDRKIAKERSLSLLKQSGSLLIYPEGAWNITENEPVMKLFSGTADFALQSGADIVPVALERYGKHYYANIGKELLFSEFSGEDKHTITAELRDCLATLKWDIWAYQGLHRRDDIPEGFGADFLKTIMYLPIATYTVQDVLDTRFRDKNVVDAKTAFQYLNAIKPTMQNAFLFNKRLMG